MFNLHSEKYPLEGFHPTPLFKTTSDGFNCAKINYSFLILLKKSGGSYFTNIISSSGAPRVTELCRKSTISASDVTKIGIFEKWPPMNDLASKGRPSARLRTLSAII